MVWIRTWHTYIGVLIAPSVLFFALTGILQIFSLHEAHGKYQPPALVEKLGRVHKDQVFALGEHHEPPPGPSPPEEEKEEDEGSTGTELLKWYFAAVGAGLFASTGMGLYMGLTHFRHQRTGWVLLIVGTLVPVVLATI
jgi:hypothetical protein